MRRQINKVLKAYFSKFDPAFLRSFHPYHSDIDRGLEFEQLYKIGTDRTNGKPSHWRKDRFFNLYSALEIIKDRHGIVVEVGCYRGLSSFLICSRLREFDHSFSGEGYTICDSFEGLSNPTQADGLSESYGGMFATSIEYVKRTLSDFPEIEYHKGWIPGVFASLREQEYKFVHIDVDLRDPTLASFEYFYPRLISGGVLVCDDYGAKLWKGTKGAVDAFCERNKCRALRLSTGQIIIFKN